MFITIINDCHDANAVGRQTTRVSALFAHAPNFVGVSGGLNAASELEAAGNLIDCLDAAGEQKGVILVNVAPRSGTGRHWGNGTPFGYFHYHQTLVVSSIAGLTLSLVKKLQIAQEIHVLDLASTMQLAALAGWVSETEAEHTIHTQFRSFDFVPRAARWLVDGQKLPHTSLPISDIPDAPSAVWMVDNFGNCKTTVLTGEAIPSESTTRFGHLPQYARLADVPDGETALITGSSGLGIKRFLEIVVQGKPAAQTLGITVGEKI